MYLLLAIKYYPGYGESPTPNAIIFGGMDEDRGKLETMIPIFTNKILKRNSYNQALHCREYQIKIWHIDEELPINFKLRS